MSQALKDITGRGRFVPYHMPRCFELDGRDLMADVPGRGVLEISVRGKELLSDGKSAGYDCVKCGDGACLIAFGGCALLYAEDGCALSDGEGLYAPGSGEEFEDWSFECHFASGLILPCAFGNRELRIGDGAWKAQGGTCGDIALFRAETEDGVLTLAVDTGRLIVYGALGDMIPILGVVEFPYP